MIIIKDFLIVNIDLWKIEFIYIFIGFFGFILIVIFIIILIRSKFINKLIFFKSYLDDLLLFMVVCY